MLTESDLVALLGILNDDVRAMPLPLACSAAFAATQNTRGGGVVWGVSVQVAGVCVSKRVVWEQEG